MAGVADSAVGAILEIPPSALQDIQKAERYITNLQITSKRAAEAVKTHWGNIATSGLGDFIQKLADAQNAMKGLGTINVTLNTQAAVQSTEQLSSATQKTSADVSKAAQTMASSFDGLTKVDISKVLLELETFPKTFQDIENHIKNLKNGLKEMTAGSVPAQYQTNQIRAWEELIRVMKLAEDEKNRALSNVVAKQDKVYLDEQKRLLAEILDLRKQVNGQKIVVAQGQVTGSSTLEQDKKILSDLITRLYEAKDKLKEYNAEKYKNVSAEGQAKAQVNTLNQENALIKEQMSFREKLNSAIARGNELVAQTQAGKARLGSSDESVAQRQLNSDYKEMLKIIKEQGELKAKVASEGRQMNQDEINLIATLAQRYRTYYDDIKRIEGAYANMAQASAQAFQNDKTAQMSRNAVLLADANENAAKAALKRAEAEAKAEEKAIAAGDKIIAQKEAQIAKQEASDKQAAQNYEKWWLSALEKRAEAEARTNQALASEYKKLITRLQELNDAMNKFQAAGGNVNSASYRALENEVVAILARRKEIEKMDIAEVNQYRLQMNQSAYQQDLSAWIQYEAQKTAKSREEAEKRLAKYRESLQSYQGAMRQADAVLSGDGSRHLATNLENIKRAINDLKSASGKLNLFDPSDVVKAEQIKKKIAELTKLLNRYKEATNVPKEIISPQQAINMAKSATTLRELEAAYKALKEAMANTKASDPQWAKMNTQLQQTKTHIDDIKKKMGEFQSQAQKTSNIMGQLQGRIAAAFSVGAINGFIKKMVETRAQFELQRVALGAIIQDRDEANKIFTQVQNMALESPFSIMQLEKATKQIAAFGFEAKKLVPTMKMFADISAGLGVEIDRLVLVMGHLKARNYLEGTMVRQFTNMGFNILGNLADYYSELENKMVSVGEVQERVKKKMVSFADVEEVLKRVTSAGGMFYDMQKKQSDSIWGQMQRIKDAYDLMLNEIGQSNESSIKGALTLIRTLINSWRTLLPIIQATGAAIVVYFSVSRWAAISAGVGGVVQAFKNMTTVIWGTKAAQDALNASQKANAWGLLISLIVAATVAIYEFATAQSKLDEAMDRVRNEGIGNMYDLIYQYQKLADTVRDTNKPYEEQKKALDEIKRIYADILPSEMLEIKNIKAMSDGYEKATAAIKAYSAEKTKSNLKAEIENIVGKDIQDAGNTLADKFVNVFHVLPDKMPKDTLRTIAKTMIAEISEEVKSGALPAEKAMDELNQRMVKRLRNLIPDSEAIINRFFEIISNWAGYENTLRRFENQIKGIDIGITDAESDELVIVKKQYQDLTDAVNEYKKAIEALRLAKEAGQVKGELTQDLGGGFTMATDGQMGREALENLNKAQQELEAQTKRWGVTWKTTVDDVNASIESQTGQMNYFEQTNTNVFTRILSGLDRWQAKFRNDDSVRGWVERTLREADKLDLSDVQNKILDVALSVTAANGMQVGSLDKLRLASLNSFGDAAKAAQGVYNQLAQNEIAIRTQINTLTQYGYTAARAKSLAEAEFGAGLTMEEIKEMMNLYKELIPAFGGTFKDPNKSKKSSDTELKRWQDLKKAIEDVSTAYDKYRKSFTVEESNKRIEELFGPVFKELNADIKQFYKDGKYDAESMIKALEVLKGMTKATTEERKKFRSEIERKIGTTQVEVEVKMKEDAEKKLKADLDEMFANYELSEELKKLGVSVDLTYMVGGRPTTLADIRKEIARLRAEGGDKADAENRIKILEEAEKKITQIELKAQKERLKNYEKYLKNAYSDSAKVQLEYYTKLSQMQEDFAKAERDLNAQLQDPNISAEDKLKIQQALENLPNQASRAAKGMREEMEKELDKLNLDKLLKSPLFSEMFQDLGSMTNKVLDIMLVKIRDIQKSANDLSLSEVRRLAQYAEKIENAKIDNSPFKEAYDAIKKAYELRAKGITAKSASDALAVSEEELERLQTLKNDISLILGIKEKSYQIDGQSVIAGGEQIELTQQQLSLLGKSTAELNEQSNAIDKGIKKQKQVVTANAQNVQVFKNAKHATEKFGAALQEVAKLGIEAMNAIKAGLQVFGKEIGEEDEVWLDFVGNMLSTCITLGIAFVALGIQINSALGIIGIIATALSVVAQLFTAIFQAHDKRLEKQIENVQKNVNALERAFDKLKTSIDNAFKALELKSDSQKAIQNLQKQKQAYLEIIRLEEAKKKTDQDKIDEYRNKIEDINDSIKELQETITEKWGGFGSQANMASAVQAFADAWLDAYKDVGDGLSALEDKWDEYIDNLIKKQIALRYVGPRMEQFMKLVDQYVSKGSDQDEYLTRQELDKLKELKESLLGGLNTELKEVMDYLGYSGGTGELILSDLQKGIQNITEPQAAAIEAYLNSMRFAVFRHTEQLDTLIATIQMQYGSGAENPVVTELKGIRGVLDNIDRRLASVINTQGRNATLRIGGN